MVCYVHIFLLFYAVFLLSLLTSCALYVGTDGMDTGAVVDNGVEVDIGAENVIGAAVSKAATIFCTFFSEATALFCAASPFFCNAV